MIDRGIADETRRRGGRRGVPPHERPDVGLKKRKGKVASGRQGPTSPVVGEIDRPRRGRDERLSAERTSHRVSGARHKASGDSEPEAGEHDLRAGAVRRGARWPAEGALERIPQSCHS